MLCFDTRSKDCSSDHKVSVPIIPATRPSTDWQSDVRTEVEGLIAETVRILVSLLELNSQDVSNIVQSTRPFHALVSLYRTHSNIVSAGYVLDPDFVERQKRQSGVLEALSGFWSMLDPENEKHFDSSETN
jgi:hypothetical protein